MWVWFVVECDPLYCFQWVVRGEELACCVLDLVLVFGQVEVHLCGSFRMRSVMMFLRILVVLFLIEFVWVCRKWYVHGFLISAACGLWVSWVSLVSFWLTLVYSYLPSEFLGFGLLDFIVVVRLW